MHGRSDLMMDLSNNEKAKLRATEAGRKDALAGKECASGARAGSMWEAYYLAGYLERKSKTNQCR